MDKLKNYLIKEDSITKDAYFWNTVSNFIFAFQSVIILMVLTRTVDIDNSGIFSLAYANACLFLLVGKYGVRNYHVSDVKNDHSFKDYKLHRIITTVAMVVGALLYVLYAYSNYNYSPYKCVVVILACVYKVPDVIEDVYHGEYQRLGRLDVAAKCMAIRLIIAVGSLILCLIFTKDLVVSLIVSIVLSFISMWFLIKWTIGIFETKNTLDYKSIRMIFVSCLPLFIGGFLSQYISNAPKYAIDAILSDSIQACYGFIAMPIFIISLISSMIFNPTIHKMAELWEQGDKIQFLKRLFMQLIFIVVITVAALIGGWFLGIPVLSIMYNTDLTAYKTGLMILLVGGGFLAVSNLINIVLTIMRAQFKLLVGYGIVAILAFFGAKTVVENYGVLGATYLYTGLSIALVGIFLVTFAVEYKRK